MTLEIELDRTTASSTLKKRADQSEEKVWSQNLMMKVKKNKK
jgi:hypothetical protein